MPKKWIIRGGITVAIVILLLVVIFKSIGINDAGYTTVIQYPWGEMKVKSDPGLYFQWMGKTEVYKKEGTYSFLKPTADDIRTGQAEKISAKVSRDESGSSAFTEALPIRYNDGGTGHIYGKARFRMPLSSESILKIHNSFRTYDHMMEALCKVTTQNVMNLTATLMSSEESYTTAKEKFQRWSRMQMINGPFETTLTYVKVEGETGKTEEVQRAAIKYDGKGPVYSKSPLKAYLIDVTQVQIVNWTYEPSTLEQVQKKRKALMAIVQAKAEAEEANQEKLTAEAQGLAAVMKAKYEKEVVKTQALVDAQREKEVAVITAQKRVAVNKEKLIAARLDKQTAEQEKLAAIERGTGEAEARNLKMKADGALEQKLAAWMEVNKYYADSIAKYQGAWVPGVVLGGGGGNLSSQGANGAQTLIDLLTAKTARDLNLDMSLPKTEQKK